jgi:hypothetical protein
MERMRLWTFYVLFVFVVAWLTYTLTTVFAAWLAGTIH